jgi:hypothetical protein
MVHSLQYTLLLAVVIFMWLGCSQAHNTKTEPTADNIKMAEPPSDGLVQFTFGEPQSIQGDRVFPKHEVYLLIGDSQISLGSIEGWPKRVPRETWPELGIPASALDALHHSYWAEDYYYAIREGDRMVVYKGSRSLPVNGDDGKMIYEYHIDPMLIGRWEDKERPEIWVQYSGFDFFTDIYQEGISYHIKGDSLFTGLGEVYIIDKLTDTELLTRAAYDTFRYHWVRPHWE